ncbi:MAG: hypothetical protein ACXAEN_26015, partial [Candidatus Thorarchaeota archaeon]
DDVSAQDGNTYSVVEEDTNDGRGYTNDTLDPNNVGTFTGWTCPGNCFVEIDEGEPNDGNTTYADSGVVHDPNWANDSSHIEDYALASEYSIDEVRWYSYSRMETAGGGTYFPILYPCIYANGATWDCETIFESTDITYDYDNQALTRTWSTNPDDSEAWADADIDALEIGMAYRAEGASDDVSVWTTLMYAQVQSSTPLYDYTADFRFEFTGIDLRQKPYLEVAGYRTGDTENIQVQVSRAGSWVTLSSDAFDTTLTTTRFGLSTTDVLGGSATVRIVDADNTDDDQTTIYIDEIFITTEGDEPNPSSSIRVFTNSEYHMWENRIQVSMRCEQRGGPEPANIIAKWIFVSIDGHDLGQGIYPMHSNSTYLPVPWNFLDGGMHNATIVGYCLVAWTSGEVAYQSEPEKLVMDNFVRWVFLLVIFLIILVVVVAVLIKLGQGKHERRVLREAEEE